MTWGPLNAGECAALRRPQSPPSSDNLSRVAGPGSGLEAQSQVPLHKQKASRDGCFCWRPVAQDHCPARGREGKKMSRKLRLGVCFSGTLPSVPTSPEAGTCCRCCRGAEQHKQGTAAHRKCPLAALSGGPAPQVFPWTRQFTTGDLENVCFGRRGGEGQVCS